MSERLIPNGHQDFLTKVGTFVHMITEEPQRFALSSEDVQRMTDARERLGEAYRKSTFGGRSEAATRALKAARDETATLYKRFIERIRVSEAVDSETRFLVGIRPRSDKKHARPCPQEPPLLSFVQALHVGSGALPMHELAFRARIGSSQTRPEGAARLELFVDLIPSDEPIPRYPGDNHGGRPWYLRSYTRTPFRLAPPIARVPMMVVYWGRWADATGNVGPFSMTVISRIEGWSPDMTATMRIGFQKPVPVFEDTTAIGPGDAARGGKGGRAQKYSVAVLDAQYESLHPQAITPQLPLAGQSKLRQIEGPSESPVNPVSPTSPASGPTEAAA